MKKFLVLVALAAVAAVGVTGTASASHSWGKYHWARTSNPFSLTLGNNTSSPWSSMLGTASNAWNASTGPSTVLSTSVGRGDDTNRSACPPVQGKVEVCNYDYGDTGWLGVAQIWIYRGGSHIAQGV